MSLALNSLRRRRQFLQVAASGRKWVAPGMIVQAWRRESCQKAGSQEEDGEQKEKAATARLAGVGFTVSRKVGNAVQRNRVRRRLRAAVLQVMPKHAMEGFDFVIIGRSLALTRPFLALIGDLEAALRKLGAYRQA